jgi:TetR/AcrR family transcriptional regulator, cholesterol catabolism regulator
MPKQRTATATQRPRARAPEVLKVAVATFASKGYENTSMQEIGEALGLLKGSIYYYVVSKEELLFSLIKAVHGEMMSNLERAKTRNGEVEERLRAFLTDLIALTADRLEHATVFQREFRHLSDAHRAEITRERREYEQYLQSLLAEGQDAGIIRADIAVEVMSTAGLTMITAIPTWYRRKDKLGKEELIRDYTELLISSYGVTPR